MLNENIRAIRKSKGLSQEELAIKLNVVRQTISKWEQGLSVPDSDMLLAISEALETPVSTLLGETVAETKAEDLSAISQRLEVINLQLARRKDMHRKIRPDVKFCVSVFRQKSRMAQESRADSGLNPLVTENHSGQNGMRAAPA